MVKGFGLIALFLAAEAAFLFHAALPARIAASAPVVQRAEPAPPPPRAAALAPCPCPCEATRC